MLILASISPRRKELLKKITSEFKVIPSNITETANDSIEPLYVSEYLATQKAINVLKDNPNDIVIAADTTIVYDNKLYGKPTSKQEAKNMLKLFSGKVHNVVTGVCVASSKRTLSFSSVNEVEFYKLEDDEIDNYLKYDEYLDKAGAYAIQGISSLFIKRINGDYNAIVGLPIGELKRVLKNFF